MIYLVTKQKQLFDNPEYKIMSVLQSLSILKTWTVIQCDSETSGRDCHINDLLCVQFGNKKADMQIVVDTATVDIKLYKDIMESKLLIFQNGKFDLQFFFNYGIIPRKIYDTMIVEQLLYLGYPPRGKYGGVGFGLHDIAERRLGIDIDKTVRGEIIWRGLDTLVIKYAAGDVIYLEDIMWSQVEDCKAKDCLVGAKLECDFVPSIAYLEWCGIKLDVNKWQVKMQNDQAKLKEKREELNKLAISWGNKSYYTVNMQGDLFNGFDTEPKCTINWSASRQVIKVAQYLGFDTEIEDKKTGEGKDTVVEKHLKAQKGINDNFLEVYFDYQAAAKLCSTYGQNYINAINPKTGRIHTTFRQLGASSGRMTCGSTQGNKDLAVLKGLLPKDCNYVQLQTLPSDPANREAFVSDEGNLFCSIDYSALESRLGADIYNEAAMIEEYLHGGGDIHSLVASRCFPELKGKTTKEIKDDFPHLRKKAKPVGFASQFGGGAKAIKDSLNCTLEEAETIANAYLEGFPGIATFKEKGSKFVKENGYIVINPITGHRLNWWDWKEWCDEHAGFDREFWDRYKPIKSAYLLAMDNWEAGGKKKEEKPRKPPIMEKVSMHFKKASKYDRLSLNTVTQGTGIIILKHAITQWFNWVVENDYFGKILLCDLVHDEVCIEFPKELEDIVVPHLVKTMEEAAAKFCKKLPIPAEAATGLWWIH